MKNLVLSLVIVISFPAAFADFASPYAPRLKDVVLAYDGGGLLPTFYQWFGFMEVMTEMPMDRSCPKFATDKGALYCVHRGTLVQVGTYGEVVGRERHKMALAIKWLGNTEIAEIKHPNGGVTYTVRLK